MRHRMFHVTRNAGGWEGAVGHGKADPLPTVTKTPGPAYGNPCQKYLGPKIPAYRLWGKEDVRQMRPGAWGALSFGYYGAARRRTGNNR